MAPADVRCICSDNIRDGRGPSNEVAVDEGASTNAVAEVDDADRIHHSRASGASGHKQMAADPVEADCRLELAFLIDSWVFNSIKLN